MPSFKNFSYDDALNVANCSEVLQAVANAFNASHAEDEIEPEFIMIVKTMNFKNDEDRQDFITRLQNTELVGSDPVQWTYEWDDVSNSKHISIYSVLLDNEFGLDLCVETALESGEKTVVKKDMSLLVKSLFSGFREVTDKYGIPIDTSYNMFLEMFDNGLFGNK